MSGNSTCRSCGGALSGSERFCPGCGSEQSVPTGAAETIVAPASLATHCPACSTPVQAGNSFCVSCGASLQDAATVPSLGSLERLTTDRLVEATTGEFEVLQRIGHGAMGSVFLARDVALSRRVAIKVISPQLLQDETMVARFRLEAQTVAALRHPNIVNLHGVRQLGDLHYFIMDFIDGPSLRAVMKGHAPLEIPVAQALLFQIGSALGYAHRRGRGVIHRDVKPANVMVDREGNAVVMDFGISKVGAAQSGLTQTGATIGTPEYMSPEQCMDQELSGASDQYALGIVAYEMLTGAVPFRGSTYAIMMAHAQGTPPSIREKRPDCPADIEGAVMRMLAKSPVERFADLGEAVAALGGTPLGHPDPVRDRIMELVGSVSDDEADLDESSPLSPVPPSRPQDPATVDPAAERPAPSSAGSPAASVAGAAAGAVAGAAASSTADRQLAAAASAGAPTAAPPPPAATAPLVAAAPPAGGRTKDPAATVVVPPEERGAAPRSAAPRSERPTSATSGGGSRRAWIGAAALIVVALGVGQVARSRGTSDARPISPATSDGVAGSPTAGEVVTSGDPAGVAGQLSGATGGAEDARDGGDGVESVGAVSDPDRGGNTLVAGPGGAQPSGRDPDPPVSVDPVVATVRIVGGSAALREGASAPITATGLTPDGTPVGGATVQWSSSNESAATVRGGQLVGVGAGVATITGSIGEGSGSIPVTVLALPPREEVAAMIQDRVVRTIGDRDAAGVERLLGRQGRGQRSAELYDALRQQNLRAQLDSLGDVLPRGNAAYVDFRVAVAWRQRGGERAGRQEMFRALLQPTPAGWVLDEMSRRER